VYRHYLTEAPVDSVEHHIMSDTIAQRQHCLITHIDEEAVHS